MGYTRVGPIFTCAHLSAYPYSTVALPPPSSLYTCSANVTNNTTCDNSNDINNTNRKGTSKYLVTIAGVVYLLAFLFFLKPLELHPRLHSLLFFVLCFTISSACFTATLINKLFLCVNLSFRLFQRGNVYISRSTKEAGSFSPLALACVSVKHVREVICLHYYVIKHYNDA